MKGGLAGEGSPTTTGGHQCSDELKVYLRVPQLGGKSFPMEYALTAGADGRRVANGKTVQVSFDYEAGVTRPIPDETRSRIAAFEGL